MIDCCILMPIHPCISVDLHQMIPPPPAAPTPLPAPIPYFWVQVLMGISGSSKYTKKTKTMSFPAMDKGTDIGKFIVHIGNPMNLKLPLIIAFSSSKSMFGANSVKFENHVVGTACLVYTNLNQNCNHPCAAPTGVVIAPNTVQAGMTLGDYFAGVLNMGLDSFISWGIGKLAGGDGLAGKAMGTELAKKYVSNAAWHFVTTELLGEGIKYAFDELAKAAGADIGNIQTSVSESIGAAVDEGVQAVSNFFNDPGIEEIGDFPEQDIPIA